MSQFQFLATSVAVVASMLMTPVVDGQQTAPSALDSVTAMKHQTHGEIRKAVAALKQEDVAWRKIQWETCLFKGLKRSKDEKKPVLLWVFIDRPTDDERC